MAAVYIGRGSAVFDFAIPPEFENIEIESLQLSIQTDDGWTMSPSAALYNWTSETWLELEAPELGVNTVTYEPSMRSEGGEIHHYPFRSTPLCRLAEKESLCSALRWRSTYASK